MNNLENTGEAVLNAQTVDSKKEVVVSEKIFLLKTEEKTTTVGKLSVPEKKATNSGAYGTIPPLIKVAFNNEESFTPTEKSKVETKQTITLFGAEINFGIRAGFEINAKPNGKKPAGPLYLCFVAGTKIEMINGESKNIEDVTDGDVIKSYNFKKQIVEEDVVINTSVSENDTFIEIKFDDGETNVNTKEHPYFTKEKGWASYKRDKDSNLKCKKLKVGDIVFKLQENNLIERKIVSIKIIRKKMKSYNLMNVKKNNNFFANRILVHNKFIKND